MNQALYQIIVPLLAAHVLSDFLFQTDQDIKAKIQPGVLLKHCLIVTVFSYIFTGIGANWIIPLVIFVSHIIIDYIKIKLSPEGLRSFTIDQIVHITIIIILSILVNEYIPPVKGTFGQNIFGNQYYVVLLVITGFFVSTHAGSVIIDYCVKPFLSEQIREGGKKGASSETDQTTPTRGFEKGGKVIGQLERAIIFILILAGQPSVIGFLIAAKSLFRFGEIGKGGNRKEVEYIIIGTFMSFLFAIIVSYLTTLAIAHFK